MVIRESYWTGVGGVVAGMGLMYLLDPTGGRRRRAELEHHAQHLATEVVQAGNITATDLANRARGFLAEVGSILRADWADDRVINDRVRSALGRACSHASAIETWVEDRRVSLSGPILQEEVDNVLRAVRRVRGVRGIDNLLEIHASSENVPALQGGAIQRGEVPELLQRDWAPSARLFVGASGLGLATWGIGRRDAVGWTATGAGALLLARSATNLELRRLIGIGAGRSAVELDKIIHVHAPLDEVYRFFTAFENFPRFMTHVREVRPLQNGRWHWVVAGPIGATFEWDAEVTRLIPRQLVAWKSTGHPAVQSAGIVRFEDVDGATRLNVRLSYNPPAGAIGHAFAKLLGADARKQLDDDLLRLKSILETGKATGVEGTVRREDLPSRTDPVH